MDAVYLLASLGALIFGGEMLVRGAASLALRAGVSSLFVGLTIVGFGTSSPELGASLTATLADSSDISVGNVIGSNIFNIAVILGITALIRPIRVQLSMIRRDLFVALAAATVPWLSLFSDGVLPRALGLLLLLALVLYLVASYRKARRAQRTDRERIREEVESTLHLPSAQEHVGRRWWEDLSLIAIGFVALILGSRFFVLSAISIARMTGLSELFIGLAVVSAGTSMPELITSLVAARRGNSDIAVGTIIGSNIFNVFGILGVCSAVQPQLVGRSIDVLDTPVMVLATLALLPIVKTGGCISRREGVGLLLGYLAYFVVIFQRAT